MKKPPLETVETLARRLGLPERTIVREVMRTRLPYVSIAGNWRFRERDIQVWRDRTGALPRLRLLAGGATTPTTVDTSGQERPLDVEAGPTQP